ncbi:MAG: hypothetical protein NDJ90_15415 [Oligoflexia bacterium]|nr:hypothetical protein [Oligoflexia bacterium]
MKSLMVAIFLSVAPLLAHAEMSEEFRQVKLEAETCLLQIDATLYSVDLHLETGYDLTPQICFDMGQLATYIKLFDLSIDRAKDDFMKLSVEERHWFRIPMHHRDKLLGACGIVGDVSMPQGDFKELRKRLTGYHGIFELILKSFKEE